jgi:hypothetical protein
MVGLLLAALIIGSDVLPAPCDLDCERQAAEQLLQIGEPRAAVDRLRQAVGRFPEDRRLVLLLARAYLLEGNLFWAERSLREGLKKWPEDSELRAWLAAVHIRQGDPELVREELGAELEPEEGPQRTRWRILAASQARLAGDREAAEQELGGLSRHSEIYPEDREMWAFLHASADPWWSESISGDLELGGGHTSNALAGSPTDPGVSGGPSGLALVNLRSRFVPPAKASLRPAIELDIFGNGLSDELYREMSTLQGSLRLGAVLAGEQRRLSFGYRAEALFLNQDSSLFSRANRAELEVEWTGGRVVFGGGGHRDYRDERRTRWEADVGMGGPLRVFARVPLIGGATLRLADANSQAYDQVGVSAAVSAQIPTGRGSALRIALSGAWDDYPNSGGEEGRLVFGTEEKRRDLLGRVSALQWAPLWKGLRPGIELRYTKQNSTADQTPGFDFSYDEWRVVVWLWWRFAADPWAPRVVDEAGHVPLDWGLESDAGMDEERILDLLRRDEELRRGSSCGIP